MTPFSSSGAGQTMPTLFVPHGAGPCFFMDWNPPTAWNAMADFLKGIAATLPARPTAIVLVSGHWLQSTFSVTTAARPTLIYDYHGFPPHTYELRYPAPGDPALASRIAGLLDGAALGGREDAQRGFDHGMFIPLKLMFPDADIPVVQLSLRSDLDPRAHIEAGRALQALRGEGVLIVGSGMSFHNMRGYGDPRFAPISDEFDHWLTAAVELPPGERDWALQRWEDAPAARLCHPPRAEEHLIPLLVAAGAAGDSNGRKVFSDRVMHTTLSAYRFG
ncbi:DODA-type extradiol aromatic ring-opening family dioxygenase [Stutzerimonas stutzeri]|jgi:aromatic ring-opening dioxygenase catalytic subunit (LigB family)|uniref:Catalytic LigB subunit of aromatic ring-opening dioxygenase n=1 Tax=Stutzerimonas stutzeri (strain A1501) TaxID=379731 RepID=A4VLF9_STUS1|nr:class III extradiol ring-cleavage dioxygenase [Stutzerimonas stutzeri]OHC20677.1 MAG: dioxygenase [Pseudomonadales bacterium RIFCSPHIGHO2_01_FULL_64_12]HAB86169.1 dioxygenase [Pseudomonas sp.]ABP79810.1 catalytic LigB subunit of aromatic ring-opening dioxygenase [Stutzerimonas stutzeri A1501]MCP3432173.1 dioxygenase [Stutzerimonas stutzeri]MCQ4224615.1 dioxygenase [Stutzerimonas stutzeri]